MPIVVAILGVVIVVMGVLLFTLSPAKEPETTPLVETQEMNRTETMEAEEEATIEVAPVIEAEDEATVEVAPAIEAEATINEPAVVVAAATFTGSGSYLTPARSKHELDVTLTVEKGIVTAANVVYDNGAGFSNGHQERFDNAYKAQVVGKPLGDISLSRVGGASLTTEGFNQAVAAIKAQQT